MFASSITKQIEIEDGVEKGTVTIRKLSARSLDKAREARQLAVMGVATKFGPELMKSFREAAAEKREAAPEGVGAPTVDARYGEFDRTLVLTQGVASWTFIVPLTAGLEDLDEGAAELLFHEIIDLSYPAKAAAEQIENNA